MIFADIKIITLGIKASTICDKICVQTAKREALFINEKVLNAIDTKLGQK